MKLLEDILNKILLKESVSVSDVEDAIDNHKRVIINYHSKGENNNTGARVIEVYAYGLTKAGNPCIRAFQPYGDTTTRVPSWKFFRLDRISDWKTTKQTFSRPADFYYKNLGEFNPNGDETMSVVYKIASFNDENASNTDSQTSSPKTKEDIFKTDTEHSMERLRQQLENPITISDIKNGDKFKTEVTPQDPKGSSPKTKSDIIKEPEQADVYKTDTEKGIENLKKQLQNPKTIDLSQFDKKPRQKSKEEQERDLNKLRQTLKDKQPITLADLNKKMNEPQTTDSQEPEVFKTDTEKNLEHLRQQLKNPQKIDLDQIPRK